MAKIVRFQVVRDDREEIVVWALDDEGRLWEFRCLTSDVVEAAAASCDPRRWVSLPPLPA